MFSDNSNSKHQVETNQGKEDRLKLALEASQQGVWDWNIATGEVFYDNQWLSLLGYSLGEVEITPDFWESRVHPSDKDRVMQVLNNHLSGKIPFYKTEHRVQALDGSYIWISDQGKVVERDEVGKAIRIVGTTIDISAGKKAKMELLSVENKFYNLIQTVPDALVFFNYQTLQIIEVNPSAILLYGYSRAEFIGLKLTDLSAEPEKTVRLTRDKDKNVSQRYHCHANGTIFPVEVTLGTFTDDDSDFGIKIIRDITARKTQEINLKRSEEKYRSIIENITDGLWIFDFKGNILEVNESACGMLGWSCNQVRGKNLTRFVDPPLRVEILRRLKEIISEGASKLESVLISDRGGKIPVSVSAKLISREGNGLIQAFVRDISEHKRVEVELKLAKERAEEADRMKSVFLANMSHEIRTPITGILGFANLLEHREYSREQSLKFLGIINNSGKVLLNLINDIIDVAKIESGQVDIELEKVNLKEMISEVQDFFKAELVRRKKPDIELIVETPGEYCMITDPVRLRQILNNLVGNAVKFTEKGIIRVDYTFVPGPKVHFKIEDTGLGMDKSDVHTVFDRFKRAVSNKGKEGTGLGLAISKGLVHLLGGEIWVESVLDKGSVFHFTLPANDCKGNSIELVLPGQSKGDVFRANWTGKVILVVEDDDSNYLLLNELLAPTGVKLVRVMEGESAIKYCMDHENIALVLMDVQLPGIDGFEALRTIKKLRKSLPVIIHTAYAFNEHREKGLSSGCDEFISKPLNVETFVPTLSKFVI